MTSVNHFPEFVVESLALPPRLTEFNKELGSDHDFARYESLKTEIRNPSPLIRQISLLQVDGFIPAKLAILLKNNLSDRPFIQNSMAGLLYELQHDGKIGRECFNFLHGKLEGYALEEILDYLHAINLYSKIAEHQNSTVEDPRFHFVSPSIYSGKVTRQGPYQFQEELLRLKKEHAKHFLNLWLKEIKQKNPATGEISRQVDKTLLSLPQDPEALKKNYIDLLNLLSNQAHISTVEKICWNELADYFNKVSPQDFVKKVHERLSTEKYLRSCIDKLSPVVHELQNQPAIDGHTIEKCKKAYNGIAHLFQDFQKNMPICSPTRFALYAGRARQELVKVNAIFSRATQHISHQLCSCQSEIPPKQNQVADWPFNFSENDTLIQFTNRQRSVINEAVALETPEAIAAKENRHENTIAIIGCDWGGGHREVSRGLAVNLAEEGYHPVTINLPKALISEDPVHNFFLTKWLGKDWTIASLFSTLLSSKAFAIVNFLRSQTAGAQPDLNQHQRKLLLTLHQLLTVNPKMVITTYSADNEVIIEAAKILGIPCLHIATDIDTSVETRTTPPQTPHFKMGIAFGEEEMLKRIEKVTTPEQVAIIGPPVRPEFSISRTKEDIQQLKQKWGIDVGKKVVVVTSGKNGVYSPYPKILAKHYAKKNAQDIPIHVVVLCAENKKFMSYLDQKVTPKTHLPMTIKSVASPSEMEELISMASEGGALIGKAGGGTIFEAASRGARLLIDQTPSGPFDQGPTHFFLFCIEWLLRHFKYEGQLPWEKINTDFTIKNDFGDVFESMDEFIPKLEKLLENDSRATLKVEVKNSRDEIKKVVKEMMEKAEEDLSLLQLRQRLKEEL